VAAIIFTDVTVKVAFSRVDEPMAELNASLSFNFVSPEKAPAPTRLQPGRPRDRRMR
jgi:hypothetical protein